MKSINMHDAKTHLSRLVEEVAKGGPIIIAKAGRPVAKLSGLDPVSSSKVSRTGFLRGRIRVPDDFDRMGTDEIAAAFEGGQ